MNSVLFNSESPSGSYQAYLASVYAWMFWALGLTGVVAYFVEVTPALSELILDNAWLLFGLLGLEVLVVIIISSMIDRLSPALAAMLFIGYSAMNGFTLAGIFTYFTGESLAIAFFVTAATFAMMSLFGFVTKKDLSAWGSVLFMGLVGIILCSFTAIFIETTLLTLVSSILGIVVFAGLVAYDTRKMTDLFYGDGLSSPRKYSILGALTLYLDFVNLFLFFIRFFGKRKNSW
ncbi:MAG TPA: Bax inhibitor-1/YccA family protein [Cyclobacteriaceae bacterium]|nr:Bax inhibitor-1/YccA family protein [Cyclobacteriaceae bacterium]